MKRSSLERSAVESDLGIDLETLRQDLCLETKTETLSFSFEIKTMTLNLDLKARAKTSDP